MDHGLLGVGHRGCSLKVGASWLRDDVRSAGAPRQQSIWGAGKVMFHGLGSDCGAEKRRARRGGLEPKPTCPLPPQPYGHRATLQQSSFSKC